MLCAFASYAVLATLRDGLARLLLAPRMPAVGIRTCGLTRTYGVLASGLVITALRTMMTTGSTAGAGEAPHGEAGGAGAPGAAGPGPTGTTTTVRGPAGGEAGVGAGAMAASIATRSGSEAAGAAAGAAGAGARGAGAGVAAMAGTTVTTMTGGCLTACQGAAWRTRNLLLMAKRRVGFPMPAQVPYNVCVLSVVAAVLAPPCTCSAFHGGDLDAWHVCTLLCPGLTMTVTVTMTARGPAAARHAAPGCALAPTVAAALRRRPRSGGGPRCPQSWRPPRGMTWT